MITLIVLILQIEKTVLKFRVRLDISVIIENIQLVG